MTVVLVAVYWLVDAIGNATGNMLARWRWALVHNPLADLTVDTIVLAIGANLAVGLLFALLYARYGDPMWGGSSLGKGMRFALIPWRLSLAVFLPLKVGGFLGLAIGAGPLPIVGNLVLHLVYGAVLGVTTPRPPLTGWTTTPRLTTAMPPRPREVLPLGWWSGWSPARLSDGPRRRCWRVGRSRIHGDRHGSCRDGEGAVTLRLAVPV